MKTVAAALIVLSIFTGSGLGHYDPFADSGETGHSSRSGVIASGSSNLLVDVEEVAWRLNIRAEAMALPEASRLLRESSDNLGKRLSALGVDLAQSLKINSLSTERLFDIDDKKKVFKGYAVIRNLKLVLSDLTLQEEIEFALLEDNLIEIEEVEYACSNHEELKTQALKTALQAAKAKATLMATELGAELGQLISVSEERVQSGRISLQLTENRIEMPVFQTRNGQPIQQGAQEPKLGKLSYQASVKAVFAIVGENVSHDGQEAKDEQRD